MGVIKPSVKGMRVEVGKVVLGQSLERAGQGGRPARETVNGGIGLPFEPPLKGRQEGGEQKRKGSEDSGAEQQADEGDGPGKTEGRIEERPDNQVRGEPQQDQRGRRHEQELFEDMAPLPVADLVGQNRDDLVGPVGGDERIEQNDPLRFSEARKIGVRVAAPFACIHLVDPFRLQARLGQERHDGLPEPFVPDRFVLVEQRSDQDRIEEDQEPLEGGEDKPGPEPPRVRSVKEQGEKGPQENPQKDGRKSKPLEKILQPEAAG